MPTRASWVGFGRFIHLVAGTPDAAAQLTPTAQREVNRLLKASIQYALDHRDEALDYALKYGRDLDDTSARWMQGFLVLAEAINRAGSTDPAKIQAALKATDLKQNQLMIGYQGVKFDQTGQNILAATYLIQLHGKKYELVWPEQAADAKLRWPMAGAVK